VLTLTPLRFAEVEMDEESEDDFDYDEVAVDR